MGLNVKAIERNVAFTSFFIQVFFRTFACDLNRLEYQTDWNIKQGRLPNNINNPK